MLFDFFNSRDILKVNNKRYIIYQLGALERAGLGKLKRLPFSIRIMLEAALRQCNEFEITQEDIKNIASWKSASPRRPAIPFLPARIIMQDFSGIPAIVDLASMRATVAQRGGDPNKINPLVPVDLVIDHSVQVDFFATTEALQRNAEVEFQRNHERYKFLKWGQKAFLNFRVVPPMTGIVHQINLEYLSKVVITKSDTAGSLGKPDILAFPDTVVGTDSHTTMINGLGVVGWGVGGIEAEAVMLGQPIDMLLPDVIGFKLHGKLHERVTATDLVLTITELLRKKGVVDKFVEFYGPGLKNISLPDRATIANMAPEYGATMGYFPVDEETLRYLRLTSRSAEQVELVEAYYQSQGLFQEAASPRPSYTDTIELDLGSVTPSLAGPKRPQDRVTLVNLKKSFRSILTASVSERGYALKSEEIKRKAKVGTNGGTMEIGHGAVVLAAITSCTNTSNPSVMIMAGLLAKKAIDKGLSIKPFVKTSLAPGSRVVTEYLKSAGLIEPLAKLGFNVVGYGCTTCIGNSGSLPGEVAKVVMGNNLIVAAVISGNRNFEGRVHPLVKVNYLASPPLVIAYALAGTIDLDVENEPLGLGVNGQPVYLKEIWPTTQEVKETIAKHVHPKMFSEKYKDVFEGSQMWKDIKVTQDELFQWNDASTYLLQTPFFQNLELEVPHLGDIQAARALVVLGDSVTTDHISPAGNITTDSPAGKYLQGRGVQPKDFNQYGARRGNHQVMMRGTFANSQLKNFMVTPKEGNWTKYFKKTEKKRKTVDSSSSSAVNFQEMSIFEAAMKYKEDDVPLIIIAGKEYGTGSSRDWAAKGPLLLGVRAVIAESFERIHRSNLVGMGVLPLCFKDGQNTVSIGLDGTEEYAIEGLSDNMNPQSLVNMRVKKTNGHVLQFKATALLNTAVEVNYFRNAGILQTVLRNLLKG